MKRKLDRLGSWTRAVPAALTLFGLMFGGASSTFAQGGGGGGGGGGGAGGAGAGAGAGGAGAGGAGAGVGGAGAGGFGGAGAGGFGGAGAGGAAGAGTVSTPFGSFAGGNGFGGATATPFNTTGGFGNTFGNGFNNVGNVAGFNAFSGVNPGFNGGVNPVFGTTSGQNTNFAQTPFNGYNPLLGNPAGIYGLSGTPLGSNPLVNNPLSRTGFDNQAGTNPLLFNPAGFNLSGQNSLGSNPLLNNINNVAPPGQINNYQNNPGLFNPASNSSFTNNPATIASGRGVSGNAFPINGGGILPATAGNFGTPYNAAGGFGTSYATYYGGAGLLTSGIGTYFGSPFAGYPYGTGVGYPLLAGGYSPYMSSLYTAQRTALTSSRFNLTNARASAAYAAANFYNDLASETASRSYKTSTGIRPSFDITTGNSRLTPAQERRQEIEARRDMIPRDQLIGEDGRVLWPQSAPTSPSELNTARNEAEGAVRAVVDGTKNGGRAAVRDVIAAQDKLRDYGTKALNHLSADNPDQAPQLANFLASLDYALTQMGDATPSVGPDRTTPESAPKTAGEVLKNSLQGDSKDDRKGDAPTQPGNSGAAPKSGGEAPKDAGRSGNEP